jgi:hypothetical protein
LTDDHDLTLEAGRVKRLKKLASYPEWQELVALAGERSERMAVSLAKHLLSGAELDQRKLDEARGQRDLLAWLVNQPEQLESRLEEKLKRLSRPHERTDSA